MSSNLVCRIDPSVFLNNIRQQLEEQLGLTVLESFTVVKNAFEETWVEDGGEIVFNLLVEQSIPNNVVFELDPPFITKLQVKPFDDEIDVAFDLLEEEDFGGHGLEPEY